MNDESPLKAEFASASVLVVDDSRVSARKLALAVRALDHEVETASDGRTALDLLRNRPFDAVLLDIVMPGMDGYAVLDELKSDAVLRDLPVIVVSSLEDEAGSVVRAIELGAEDFLPKQFDPAILRARLHSSLARKRFRDRELAYFRDVEQLTRAAEVIEAGAFRPSELEIHAVAERRDALGRLAGVFQALAQEIYDRERRLDQKVRTLRGILLVLAAGVTFGLMPALSRMAVGMGAPPLGLLVWVNIVAAIFCFAVAGARGGMPRLRLAHMKFFVLWAIILGLFHRLAIFFVAKHVEATVIALAGSLRGFLVFGFAALIALEPPTLRRLSGLAVGFAAICALLFMQESDRGLLFSPWMAAALLVPIFHSLHTLLMTWRPRELDTYATVGVMLVISTVLLAPVAAATGDLFMPAFTLGKLEIIILVLGISSAFSLALMLDLVALAGAVFASQAAYSQTIAGVLWAMLLLNEQLSQAAWIAVALVLIGIWLVEPKRAGEDFAVTLRLPPRRSQ